MKNKSHSNLIKKKKKIIKQGLIPVIEPKKEGYWEIYIDKNDNQIAKFWHKNKKILKNFMPNQNNFEFVSPFIRGADLPEGEPVSYTVRKDEDGNTWGFRESKGDFGCEVIFPDGRKTKIDFFVNLKDDHGQDKLFTRTAKSFYYRLKELNPQEGETLRITRVGEGKQARYTLTKGNSEKQNKPEGNDVNNEQEEVNMITI